MDVPKPGDDKPRLGRVAIITVLGFLVGVLWPRLAGVKLVPSAPSEGDGPAAAAPAESASSAPLAPPAAKAAAAETPKPAVQKVERLKVSEPKITSCRDKRDARQATCDAIDIDSAVRAKILTLATCKGSENVQGTLSIGLELDFAASKVVDVLKGKSTTIADASANALIECVRTEVSTLSLRDIKHEHAKYTLFYIVELLPPGAKADEVVAEGSSVTPASGRATVGWEVAIIREHPKDGEIVARVMRGTRVVVTGRDGDWYRIKYDAKGSEGWVFRTAIGM